jgi:WD40 repeat protein
MGNYFVTEDEIESAVIIVEEPPTKAAEDDAEILSLTSTLIDVGLDPDKAELIVGILNQQQNKTTWQEIMTLIQDQSNNNNHDEIHQLLKSMIREQHSLTVNNLLLNVILKGIQLWQLKQIHKQPLRDDDSMTTIPKKSTNSPFSSHKKPIILEQNTGFSAVDISCDGTQLFTLSNQGEFYIWKLTNLDFENSTPISYDKILLPVHDVGNNYCISVSDTCIAVGLNFKLVILNRDGIGYSTSYEVMHHQPINCCQFDLPRGQYLAYEINYETITILEKLKHEWTILYQFDSGNAVCNFSKHNHMLCFIRKSNVTNCDDDLVHRTTKTYLLSVFHEKSIRTISLPDGNINVLLNKQSSRGEGGQIQAAVYSSMYDSIFSGDDRGCIIHWSPSVTLDNQHDDPIIKQFNNNICDTSAILCLEIFETLLVVGCSFNSSVRLFLLPQLDYIGNVEHTNTLYGYDVWIRKVKFHPVTGEWLLVCGDDRRITLWEEE